MWYCGLIGIGSPAMIAAYGLGGLLAGIFSKFGKIGAGIGFIIGNIVLTFYANGSTEVLITLEEIVVASVCLFFVPKKVDVVLDNLFDYNRALQEGNAGYLEEETIYKLNAVSEVFLDMAENMNQTEKEEISITDEVGTFIKALNEHTCSKCQYYEKCWKQNYHSMYETVFNSIEIMKIRGGIEESEIDNPICENKELLTNGLNYSYELLKVNYDWEKKLEESKGQVTQQLKGVSQVISKIATDMNLSMLQLKNDNRFELSIGVAKTKKNKSEISGDSSLLVKLQDGKYLLGISDGMGSGKEAEKNSQMVIHLLEKLLNTGFDKEVAINLLNSVLLLKENQESFATLDVSIFDPVEGKVEFIKVSACPTFIKKGRNVDIVKSVSLPVGILENVDIDLYDRKLETGDMLVMMTDGIMEVEEDKKTTWIVDLLNHVNTKNPQRLADIILQEAVDKEFGIPSDDMTVIVARVNEKKEQDEKI